VNAGRLQALRNSSFPHTSCHIMCITLLLIGDLSKCRNWVMNTENFRRTSLNHLSYSISARSVHEYCLRMTLGASWIRYRDNTSSDNMHGINLTHDLFFCYSRLTKYIVAFLLSTHGRKEFRFLISRPSLIYI
jgi:hypothetical protein